MAKLKKDGQPKQSGGNRPGSGRHKMDEKDKKRPIYILVNNAEDEKEVNELKLKLKR
jgi:hypothetical protein